MEFGRAIRLERTMDIPRIDETDRLVNTLIDINTSMELNKLINLLSRHYGELYPLPNPYTLDDGSGRKVIIYVGPKAAFGVVGGKKVRSIMVWDEYSIGAPIDYVIDIPRQYDSDLVGKAVLDALKNRPDGASKEITESLDEFDQAMNDSGINLETATLDEIVTAAEKYGVNVPDDIADRITTQSVQPAQVKRAYAIATEEGKEVEGVVVWGRFPSTIYAVSTAPTGSDDEFDFDVDTPDTMEEQYEYMRAQVQLVIGDPTTSIKSVLILGAPSSGKTFNVMEVINEAGLVGGRDYVAVTGSITPASMWESLVQEVNGMLIFDDCDSVAKDENGVNILKGALDTKKVRSVSNRNKNSVRTSTMTEDERRLYVERCSRILKGRPDLEDIEFYYPIVFSKTVKNGELPPLEDQDMDVVIQRIESYVSSNLPDQIDFRGTIIFISNMTAEEWNSAIITRAFVIDMNFSNKEMLDYIEKILKHLGGDTLPYEQKREVFDFISGLWDRGMVHQNINFRKFLEAFDMRKTPYWKKLIARSFKKL